ncbi:apolipoprotein N-acyltransferase [Methylophaga sp. OBS4]|uniref:apolipoprotein N-acyltransferase n=1 Tax=Methylophaga sp. OBS4 TaxID=2991935 RepID=UPI00224DF247|nr:apolipoprotein N-acyltransferase [Methylophaga sp. OBS4]MCX4186400.1 apolipoprotein N-acyltransferase [Methylophaga sp. OBS4]
MRTGNEQGLQGWKGSMVALLAGALLPLAFAPFYWYPLAVLSLVLLFFSWLEASPKQAAWRGWLFGFGMFGVGVSWVYVAIHVFGQSGMILATLLTGLFVAFLACYLALLGWFIKKLSPSCSSFIDLILLLPVAWVGFELFKGWFLSGFPWLELGVSQIEGPLAGFIPVIGVIGASWLVAVTAGLMIHSWRQKQWLWLLPVVLLWGSGEALKQVDWTQPVGTTVKTTLIQGNVPQQIKWDPEQLANTLALYQVTSEVHWDSDLIVWPENAIPAFYHQLRDFYLEPLQRQARDHQTDILLGLPVQDGRDGEYFNSMMVLGKQQGFYHKQHLVPFGDYVPFEWLRGLIAFFNLPMSAFAAGPAGQPLLTAAGQPVGISICYEDVFSTEVLQTLPEATLLINATNNAWYGDSFAPHQHLQISRSRALETGRPLVRATTNGISAFVDFKGQIQSQTPQFEQAVLTETIQPRHGETPYVSWQQWPIWGGSVFMLLLWAYYRRKKSD